MSTITDITAAPAFRRATIMQERLTANGVVVIRRMTLDEFIAQMAADAAERNFQQAPRLRVA